MAYHTYEFLKKRRNDPKWRNAYLKERNRRILSTLIMGNVLLWGVVLWRYIEKNSIDVMMYIEMMKQKIEALLGIDV